MTIQDDILRADNYVITSTNIPDAMAELANFYHSLNIVEIGGDNCGPWINWLSVAQGTPWCGAFVRRVVERAFAKFGSSPNYDWTPPADPTFWIPEGVTRAKNAGLFRFSEDGYQPKAGDVMFLKSNDPNIGHSHAGIVVVGADPAEMFQSVEGNWSDKCSRVTRTILSCDFAEA